MLRRQVLLLKEDQPRHQQDGTAINVRRVHIVSRRKLAAQMSSMVVSAITLCVIIAGRSKRGM